MPGDIETVTWRPPVGYDLAVEVLSVAELRRRGSEAHFRAPHRVAFYLLLAVTRGHTDHVVDFSAHAARARTWLLLRPGQTQRFDFATPWQGLVVVFRPEILPPSDTPLHRSVEDTSTLLAELPSPIELPPGTHALCCASLRQMRHDAAIAAPAQDRNALLLHQLQVLLLRLALAPGPHQHRDRKPAATGLVTAFRRLVDEHYRSRRGVAWYAKRLACSTRTINRATRAVAGRSAKSVIAERTILEAERLLVHTRFSVQTIGAELGFDEASNFSKHFKREAGCTPSAFRRRFSGP